MVYMIHTACMALEYVIYGWGGAFDVTHKVTIKRSDGWYSLILHWYDEVML